MGVIGRLSRRSEAEPGRAFARVPSARKPRGAKLSCKQARLSSGFLSTIGEAVWVGLSHIQFGGLWPMGVDPGRAAGTCPEYGSP